MRHPGPVFPVVAAIIGAQHKTPGCFATHAWPPAPEPPQTQGPNPFSDIGAVGAMKLHTRAYMRMSPSDNCAKAQSELPIGSDQGHTTRWLPAAQLRPLSLNFRTQACRLSACVRPRYWSSPGNRSPLASWIKLT